MRLTSKIGEKDNMLKYELNEDKEENEMIADILGASNDVP